MRSFPLVPDTEALFAEGTRHFEIQPAPLARQRAAPSPAAGPHLAPPGVYYSDRSGRGSGL